MTIAMTITMVMRMGMRMGMAITIAFNRKQLKETLIPHEVSDRPWAKVL